MVLSFLGTFVESPPAAPFPARAPFCPRAAAAAAAAAAASEGMDEAGEEEEGEGREKGKKAFAGNKKTLEEQREAGKG